MDKRKNIKNYKAIIFIIILIFVLYSGVGIILETLNRVVYDVEKVNVYEFVELDKYCIKINNINIVKKDEENYISVELTAKPKENKEIFYTDKGDIYINIDNYILKCDYNYTLIDNKEISLDEKALLVDGEKRQNLFFKIEDTNLDNKDIIINYRNIAYKDEIIEKSTKKEIFRKVGIVQIK